MGQLSACSALPCWTQALRLSAEQQEQLLLMRQNHLKQLKEVYTQRQALNQQVMTWTRLGAVSIAAWAVLHVPLCS